jgi:hypothetical protein
MNGFLKFCLAGFISFVIVRCNSSGTGDVWPDATGRSGELLIVIDNKKWQSPVGDSLANLFTSEIKGLPQKEPVFDFTRISTQSFSKLHSGHRNIVRVKISSNVKENLFLIRKNVWARPQTVIDIYAQTDSAFYKIFKSYKHALIDSLVLSDQKNYITAYSKTRSPEARKALKQKGFTLDVPQGYHLKVNKYNFVWFEQNTAAVVQGILVFVFDKAGYYHDKNLLLQQLDSALKMNIPGPVNGSFMQTDGIYPPVWRDSLSTEKVLLEVRGLWSTKGYAMGGPYVARIFYDGKKEQKLVLFGFVYAPNQPKRNYLRQIEAIMSTLQFIGSKS